MKLLTQLFFAYIMYVVLSEVICNKGSTKDSDLDVPTGIPYPSPPKLDTTHLFTKPDTSKYKGNWVDPT